MAKTDTAASPLDERKKKKSAGALPAKVKKGDKPRKSVKSDKAGKSGKKAKQARKSEGFEGLAKFVDHPLVADLLAAGALAAVAAIAEHKSNADKHQGSSKMVKSVGKAAASAMGRRLMSDIGAITTAASDAAKKA
jgi:hypothetical protein